MTQGFFAPKVSRSWFPIQRHECVYTGKLTKYSQTRIWITAPYFPSPIRSRIHKPHERILVLKGRHAQRYVLSGDKRLEVRLKPAHSSAPFFSPLRYLVRKRRME